MLPDLARRFPQIHLSFGLHPWYIGTRTANWLDTLRALLQTTHAAVGEIGLDHALDPQTFADQEAVLLAQIHLANELERPVTLHCRRAWGRLMDLLDSAGWPANGLMLHSYSGSADLIQPLSRRGAYFSFSGSITFARNRKCREALAATPPDRLLLETDAPDLMPDIPTEQSGSTPPRSRQINEPANLAVVLSTAAKLKGMTESDLAEITRMNAETLFGLNARGGRND
jgi:TatD DNase family protein